VIPFRFVIFADDRLSRPKQYCCCEAEGSASRSQAGRYAIRDLSFHVSGDAWHATVRHGMWRGTPTDSSLYVGYILMQVPSNMIINKINRPSWYIAAAMLLWGMISTCSGVVNDFGGMVATRFFLGFVEAAFLPGALLILSKVSLLPLTPSYNLSLHKEYTSKHCALHFMHAPEANVISGTPAENSPYETPSSSQEI
jgi:hypothetical protein